MNKPNLRVVAGTEHRQAEEETNPSKKSRAKLVVGVVAGALALGALFGLAVKESDEAKAKAPDFVIGGEVNNGDLPYRILGAVNLRCFERGVLPATVVADVRLDTTINRGPTRGRNLHVQVNPGQDGCQAATETVQHDPAVVIEGVEGDVLGVGPKVLGHGDTELAKSWQPMFDVAIADDVPYFPVG